MGTHDIDARPPLSEAVPLGLQQVLAMLAGVDFSRRNMLIIGVSIAVAIGLRFQEGVYVNAPADVRAILHSGLVPGAITSIVLNLVLPGREKRQ